MEKGNVQPEDDGQINDIDADADVNADVDVDASADDDSVIKNSNTRDPIAEKKQSVEP